MLVLSRKIGEAIQIGDDIQLTVLSIQGDTVKLGIQAPNHVNIYRQELYAAIQAENKQAALPNLAALQKFKEKK